MLLSYFGHLYMQLIKERTALFPKTSEGDALSSILWPNSIIRSVSSWSTFYGYPTLTTPVRKYRHTRMYVKTPPYATLCIPCSIVFLEQYEILSTAGNDSPLKIQTEPVGTVRCWSEVLIICLARTYDLVRRQVADSELVLHGTAQSYIETAASLSS